MGLAEQLQPLLMGCPVAVYLPMPGVPPSTVLDRGQSSTGCAWRTPTFLSLLPPGEWHISELGVLNPPAVPLGTNRTKGDGAQGSQSGDFTHIICYQLQAPSLHGGDTARGRRRKESMCPCYGHQGFWASPGFPISLVRALMRLRWLSDLSDHSGCGALKESFHGPEWTSAQSLLVLRR